MTNAAALTSEASARDDSALNRLFKQARTHSAWLPRPVSPLVLGELYDLLKMAPTSANCSPARFVFLTTAKAKERLIPAMAPGNVDKTRAAPVTAIIAMDTEFYEKLPKLFPHADARSWFVGNQAAIDRTLLRDTSLQGAYLILAARALGLDCGPMSGFDATKVNSEFFPDGKWKVNFVCNLGYGDREKLHPRLPRLEFDEACVIL